MICDFPFSFTLTDIIVYLIYQYVGIGLTELQASFFFFFLLFFFSRLLPRLEYIVARAWWRRPSLRRQNTKDTPVTTTRRCNKLAQGPLYFTKAVVRQNKKKKKKKLNIYINIY